MYITYMYIYIYILCVQENERGTNHNVRGYWMSHPSLPNMRGHMLVHDRLISRRKRSKANHPAPGLLEDYTQRNVMMTL